MLILERLTYRISTRRRIDRTSRPGTTNYPRDRRARRLHSYWIWFRWSSSAKSSSHAISVWKYGKRSHWTRCLPRHDRNTIGISQASDVKYWDSRKYCRITNQDAGTVAENSVVHGINSGLQLPGFGVRNLFRETWQFMDSCQVGFGINSGLHGINSGLQNQRTPKPIRLYEFTT